MLAVVFLGWLAWTRLAATRTPQVTSELETFSVDDDHTATRCWSSSLADDDVEATCTLRAYAEDHTTVGELAFTPDPARAGARSQRSAPSGGPPSVSPWAAPPPARTGPAEVRAEHC